MPFIKGQKPPRKGETIMERPDRTIPIQRTERKERIPMGSRNRLTFRNLDPDYVYRVFNDVDDRLEIAQEASYEFVTSSQGLGDKDVLDASKLGSHVSKPVGNGTKGYLMRIKREWYEEDQRAKQQGITAAENATKPNSGKGEYGDGIIKT